MPEKVDAAFRGNLMTPDQIENAIALQASLITRYQDAINANPYGTTADQMQRLSAAIAALNGLEALKERVSRKPAPVGRNGGCNRRLEIELGER